MVYYAIAPGAFLSPVIVSKLGTQLTMGVGALTYTAVCVQRKILALSLAVHSDSVVHPFGPTRCLVRSFDLRIGVWIRCLRAAYDSLRSWGGAHLQLAMDRDGRVLQTAGFVRRVAPSKLALSRIDI